jgi:hypothetical protein
MPLNYLCVNDHKQAITHIRESWWFESMYTCRGKPDQYTTRISSLVRVWSQTICISSGQCIATFHKVINSDRLSRCSREKGILTQSTARRLIDSWVHTKFLSQDTHWISGGKATLYWWQTTRLTGPITPICSQYVQYLLTGANLLVLNRHRRGLQPWRCRLSTSHSLTFPTDGPPLST